MTTIRRALLGVAALGLTTTLGACGAQTSDSATEPTSSAAEPAPTSSAPDDDEATMTHDKPQVTSLPARPTDPAGLPLGDVPDSIVQREDVQAAIAEAAKRAGVEASAVTVAGYADVTWSDGSLGCPKDGMMYTQALVPGHQLILQVDGAYLSYHAARGKPFTYCAQPSPPTSTEAGSTDR